MENQRTTCVVRWITKPLVVRVRLSPDADDALQEGRCTVSLKVKLTPDGAS